MKFIRLFLSLLVLLIALCVLAAFLLVLFMDPNRLKPVIAETLQKETGYQVTVDGACSWSFYPHLGVTVAHLAFAEGQHAPFIDLEKVTFVTKLSALLHGKLQRSQFYIDKVRLFNLALTHVDVGLQWHNQQLLLKPITARLYQGTLQGSLYATLTGTSRYALDLKANHVALQPLLQDVNGSSSKVSLAGQGAVLIRMTASGASKAAMLRSVDGSLTFNVDHGALLGVDLNALINNAKAIVAQRPLEMVPPTNQTVFDQFNGTFAIQNGVAVTKDAVLSAPAFTVNATGNIDLPANTIAMQLNVTPKQDFMPGLIVPVTVAGDIVNPVVRLDVAALNIGIAKQKLGHLMDRVHTDMQREGIGGMLKSLKQ